MFRRKAKASKYKPGTKTKRRPPSSRRKHFNNQAKKHKVHREKQLIHQAESHKSVLHKEPENITERLNRLEVERLKGGDLVEFTNGVSLDFGVYLGDDTVAHLTRISKKFSSKSSACSSNQHSSEVHMEDVFVLAGNNKVVRNNLLDEELIPLPRSEIMMRVADCLCRVDIPNFQNSTEFVTWCRYGEPPAARNGPSTLQYFNPFYLLPLHRLTFTNLCDWVFRNKQK